MSTFKSKVFKETVFSQVLIASVLLFSGSAVLASGGPGVEYTTQGKIGEVIVNPYKIAPLTAVIRNGGKLIRDAYVRVVPKEGGQEIAYKVSDNELRTHGGIPVFGLYPDYNNKVEVSYTIVKPTKAGKEQRVEKELYTIYGPAIFTMANGSPAQKSKMFDVEVKSVDPSLSNRLYFINNLLNDTPHGSKAKWANPGGGSLTWNAYPQNAIIDTKGEVRWYMFPQGIYDPESIYKAGIMMGFKQGNDGKLTWGYGQRYCKYDLLGREVFNRRLPFGYADYSHDLDVAQNGNTFLRVSSSDYKRPDGKRVHTVRDVIIEVDKDGNVVDEFRLFDILDPYRDNVIKALDQGAVCLNIDSTKAGKTMSAEELAAMDKNDNFGDIPGVGAGRNWIHVNSVDYDPSDDSIIISARHQSAIIKIGRDKKVRWILSSPDGWRKGLAGKVLKPVDKDGKPIQCENNVCEKDFDWTWTQHAAFRIDSKSNKDTIYVSAFDNGDARGMEQPALPSMKYSRAVVYKIDQKKGTVQQVWEYGKERGHDWYSPITSNVEYLPKSDTVLIYSATAGLDFSKWDHQYSNPVLTEVSWKDKKPLVEMEFKSAMGYRALPIDLEKAFTK